MNLQKYYWVAFKIKMEMFNKKIRNKNVLLINGLGSPMSIINELLSNSATDSNIYLSFPLGIMTLAGWLKQEIPVLNIEIMDVAMELHKCISVPKRSPIEFETFIRKILLNIEHKPDYVGISISFSNGHSACLKICDIIKQIWPEVVVIAGGVHATTFTHRLISEDSIDYIIRGAGDYSFIELLKSLINNQRIGNIAGVVDSTQNLASFAPALDNLDNIPPYPYELLDMEYLIKNESSAPLHNNESRTGVVFMSRGCPFGCSYCSADKIHGKKIVFKKLDSIISEIDIFVNVYKVNTICIMDDLFGADKEYFFELFRRIRKKGYNFKIAVPAGLSLSVFNEEMLDILVANGLESVYFPLESGSQYVQDHIIKKRINLKKAEKIIKYAKKIGLYTGINVVLGSPGETKELIEETYNYIKALPVDSFAFFLAFPYPKTTMTEELLHKSILTEEDLLELWDNSSQGFKTRTFDTEEITAKELSALVYDYNIELNFFSNYNLRNGNYITFITRLDKIIRRYPFHIVALACRAKARIKSGENIYAEEDINTIRRLIAENEESKQLYQRYGELIEQAIQQQ